MTEEHVYFRSGTLMLEGVVHLPAGDGPFPASVVCHPHPLYGGDMDNNVVLAVAYALASHGVAAFRFNFRGVGNSDGSYGDGAGEQEDVMAAISFLHALPQVDTKRTAVVGYSFGAYVGLGAAVVDDRVAAAVGISPPLTMFDFSFFKRYRRPKLLIVGDHDQFAPLHTFRSWVAQLPEPKQVLVVPHASHFWIGHEAAAADKVVEFLTA